MPTLELTDRFCAAAKPLDGKQTDYFDTVTTGLSLRVSPAGTKAWCVNYTRHDSKRGRMKLGVYPAMPLGGPKGARQRAKDARAKVGEGIDPVAEKRAHAASQTVRDLVENYVARHASTKRSGHEIARCLRKNVADLIGDVKLSDLHRRDLTRCIDAVKDRGAAVEANRVFEQVRAMIRWARGRGDLDENLCEGMRRPTETTPRERVLSADEIRIMWATLAGCEDMREVTRRVLRLCLISGQRVGEIAGMQRGELDLDTGVWTIPGERVKNKREHVVPLSRQAVAVIREQLAAVDALCARKGRAAPAFVFPAPGGRAAMRAMSVATAVKRQETDAMVLGVAAWTPHDLRRTFATHAEEIGIAPHVIGHILNHISVTQATITSRVYAKYDYMREKREALEFWAARLDAIIAARAEVVRLTRKATKA